MKVLQFSVTQLLRLVQWNLDVSLPLALFHCYYLLALKEKNHGFVLLSLKLYTQDWVNKTHCSTSLPGDSYITLVPVSAGRAHQRLPLPASSSPEHLKTLRKPFLPIFFFSGYTFLPFCSKD